MLYYNSVTNKRYNTAMIIREGKSLNNLTADNFYPLETSKPVGFDERFDRAVDSGTNDLGSNRFAIDWQIVPNNLDEAKATVRAELSAHRFDYEVSGIVFNTKNISTSRESVTMISSAYAQVEINTGRSTNFKTLNGWITLSAADMTSLMDKVTEHVQGAFTAEMGVDAMIDAAPDLNQLRAINISAEFASRIV